MTSTPAYEPTTTPTGGGTAPGAGATPHTRTELTPAQKTITVAIGLGAAAIAGIGFAGSFNTVKELGEQKGLGQLAGAVTLGVDIGIGVFLALDLLLTWLRIPFRVLRYGAWLLTAATIYFNASTAWPDPVGVGLHAVIPLLFVIAVEAARHAVGRVADITADTHYESPPLARWILAPYPTFRLYRRMRVWGIRSYHEALAHHQQIKIYKADLKQRHGSVRSAPADKKLVLTLASYGMSIAEAIDKPKAEARKLAAEENARQAEERAEAETEAEAKHAEALRKQAAEARRRAEIAEAEAAEVEARGRVELAEAEVEAKRRAEAARAEAAETEARLRVQTAEAEARRATEAEAKRRQIALAEAEAEAKQRLEAQRKAADDAARIRQAETDAKLAELARQQRAAAEAEEAERRERQRRAEARQAEEDRRRRAREAEERRAEEQKRRDEAARAEAKRLRELATRTHAITSGSTSASGVNQQAAATSGSTSVSASAKPSRPHVSASVSTSGTASLGGRRSKRAAEVEAVLAEIAKARDPEAVSLKWVEKTFGLPQTTAWDRLSTAQKLWADAQQKTA